MSPPIQRGYCLVSICIKIICNFQHDFNNSICSHILMMICTLTKKMYFKVCSWGWSQYIISISLFRTSAHMRISKYLGKYITDWNNCRQFFIMTLLLLGMNRVRKCLSHESTELFSGKSDRVTGRVE